MVLIKSQHQVKSLSYLCIPYNKCIDNCTYNHRGIGSKIAPEKLFILPTLIFVLILTKTCIIFYYKTVSILLSRDIR